MDSLAPASAAEDGVYRLIGLTADAWRTCLRRKVPLQGFLCAMCGTQDLRPILIEGACAALEPLAHSFADAFLDENEIWQGTAADLAERLGRPVDLPGSQRLVVHPLYAEGLYVGLIVLAVPEEVPTHAIEEWLVTFIAAGTVAALFREHEVQRAQAEVQRAQADAQRAQADALRALDAISQALSRETDLKSLYSVIHREVARVMECDAFYVCLFDGESRLDYVYRYDQGVFSPPRAQSLGNGPTTFCIRERRPFVLRAENADVHHAGTYLGQERRSESAIHVPMLVDGEPIGVLSAQSYQPSAYQETHVQLLVIIASKAATAVRNTQLLERIRNQVDNLQKLTRALQIRDLSLGRIDDFVLTSDVDGNITAYNEAVSRALGYGPTELIGRPTISLRSSGRGSWQAFQRARNRRISVTAKDGRNVPVLYSTERLMEEGEVVGYLTIAKDLSDLQRSEEARREALALERQRISRDLHDGLIQSLSIAKMQLQILQRNNVEETIRRELSELQETLSRGLTEARHYIVELKHTQVDQEGLIRTSRRYAHELGRVTGLSIGVSADTEASPLGDTDEVQMFHILREALNNVRKHARAKRVRVEFRLSSGEFLMSVEDDGCGFDTGAVAATGREHWGLQHIRERAEALGGRAEISSVPDGGTRVSVAVPLPADPSMSDLSDPARATRRARKARATHGESGESGENGENGKIGGESKT